MEQKEYENTTSERRHAVFTDKADSYYQNQEWDLALKYYNFSLFFKKDAKLLSKINKLHKKLDIEDPEIYPLFKNISFKTFNYPPLKESLEFSKLSIENLIYCRNWDIMDNKSRHNINTRNRFNIGVKYLILKN